MSSIPNPFKHETNQRNDDALQNKWASKHDPARRGDIDFTGDPGVTDPSHARDCDINNIMATYHKTGVFPDVDVNQVFADVSDAPSYQDALQIVINAENQFMSLDAATRKRFDNDPTQFLQFVDNPENAQELVKMGLATLVDTPPSPAPTEGMAPPQKASKAKVEEPAPAKKTPKEES